jgi:hypothetical protein
MLFATVILIVASLALVYVAIAAGILVIPPPPPRRHPKVFCIGLSRTGTTSITMALSRIGWHTYHSLVRLARYPSADEFHGEARVVRRWADAFDAFTDIPPTTVYQELADLYPDSLFILTSRDPEAWANSMVSFIETMRPMTLNMPNLPVRDLFRCTYGEWEENTVEDWKQTYIHYESNVLDFFRDKPGRLLQLNITDGEGWKEIAAFLRVEPPDEPFPHVDVFDLTFRAQVGWQLWNAILWLARPFRRISR